MKKNYIFSRFFTEQYHDRNFTLSELSQYIAVFYFNMRTFHFLAGGTNFLIYHEFAQECYEKAEEYYDDFIETALSYNEIIQPMFVTPADWTPAKTIPDNADEKFLSIVEAMKYTVHRLFEIMENVDKEKYSTFVYSKIDGVLEWLDKLNYKIEAMSLK